MKNTSIFLTAAVAGLVLGASQGRAADPMGGSMAPAAGAAGTTAAAGAGECHGVNGCKGKGDCNGATNSCKGQNGCKGKGWNKMSKADCDKKKGTFKAMAKM